MTVALRPATRTDQLAIRRLVWRARLYPLRLAWRRFVVADDADRLVAVGQIRHHHDGARELASVVVTPDHRGRGLARRLVTRLLEPERGDVHLVCRTDLVPFYTRFGFAPVAATAAPRSIARLARLEDAATRLLTAFGGAPRRLVIMRRPAASETESR